MQAVLVCSLTNCQSCPRCHAIHVSVGMYATKLYRIAPCAPKKGVPCLGYRRSLCVTVYEESVLRVPREGGLTLLHHPTKHL
ncbi:hypothetical protein BU23DRAFT_48721 [Bimuria novae-zelandiae CBS 107.79]|uniref:Uncharacterized protein n=1 Tax=Bimuria novae-zelandiae CBS 107.79 TaxID=1447943 RepID=A0A6A5UJC6_9PLEO|nr:hypothetical protein BU23DRAFT_48721 [Bimuria novae-zelandiae CBS 107.79]